MALEHYSIKTFKDLARLYDNDMALSTDDKINLYGALIKEPLVRDDVLQSISHLKAQLVRDRDMRGLRNLSRVCNLECFIPHKNRNVYEDGQNVHSFVDETIRVANVIIQKHPAVYFRPFDHLFLDKIESVPEFHGLSVTQLFASIYGYIVRSNDKQELLKRLKEEMDEAKSLCLTGHVCRLVNCLRGFSDMATKMSMYDYQKVKLFTELNSQVDVFDMDNIFNSVQVAINSIDTSGVNPKIVLQILKDYTMETWYYNKKNLKFTYTEQEKLES